jgi:hypothetical protein
MAKLQAMRITQSNRTLDKEVNPFAAEDNSYDMPFASNTSNFDRNHTNFKLNFPTYTGKGGDPTGWIFKAKQYFKFQNIDAPQRFNWHRFIYQMYHFNGIGGIPKTGASYVRLSLSKLSSIVLVQQIMSIHQKRCRNSSKPRLSMRTKRHSRNYPIRWMISQRRFWWVILLQG